MFSWLVVIENRCCSKPKGHSCTFSKVRWYLLVGGCKTTKLTNHLSAVRRAQTDRISILIHDGLGFINKLTRMSK